MKTKERVIVAGVIVSRDRKILLGKVREGGVYPDCWHIPGGGVDEGETKEEALIREMKEEIGIDIASYQIKLISDTGTGEAVKTDKETGEQFLVRMHFYVYQVEIDTDARKVQISLNDDLTEYRWVAIAELKNYKNTPPSEKLFTSLGWI